MKLAFIRNIFKSGRKKQLLRAKMLGFDHVYYRNSNSDLHHLNNPEDLYEHYIFHGRQEGRLPNQKALIADLESKYGSLPENFQPQQYVSLHMDLKRARFSDRQAIEHYLHYGKSEGRAYILGNYDIVRELYLRGQIISDRDLLVMMKDEEFSKGKIVTGLDIMKSKGLKGGGKWIEQINVDEFACLNFSWAGEIATRMGAVDAMLSDGIERLAPLSLSLAFDVDFYRELQPDLKDQSPDVCYRHWLFEGFENGIAGSPRQFFDDLDLSVNEFPESFQWRQYLRSTGNFIGSPNRWSALKHFVESGFSRKDRFIKGHDAIVFYKALGTRYLRDHVSLSVKAFESAQRFEALDGSSLELLAEGYFRLHRWDQALATYEDALKRANASPSGYCKAAQAAVNLKKFDHAFRILRTGASRCHGLPEWRKTVRESIEAEFELAMSKARDLLKERDRDAADRLLIASVARTAKNFSELDPVGIVLPVAEERKVVTLANLDSPQCTHYRVEQKRQIFEVLQRPYQIFATAEVDAFISALPGASAAIFYRLPALPMVVRAIEVARAMGIPTYYEIDDLIFDSNEYPEPYETYGSPTRPFYESLQIGVPLFRAAMSLCDYGISSTTGLADHMRPIVRKQEVHVLPNGLDDLNTHFLQAPPRRTRQDDSIIIFYGSGTTAHNSDFMTLAGPALVEIMADDARVKLMVLGSLTLDASFDPVRSQVITVGWTDLDAYWSLLAEADILIAVLAPYATTNAKSELKWFEAAALGVPSVVSATSRYKEVLEHDVDALIASNPSEWNVALRRLIADPDLRQRIVTSAREKISRSYTIEANAKILASFLPNPKFMPAGAKKRILLVNVFFHPQSLGGSPRVVRDNLDCFLDSDAHRDYEFAVATTDVGGEGLKQIRVENYRGCPVFRISPPAATNIMWQPDLAEMGRIFSDIIEVWRPDLVHFNCIQKFSGAVVESCLEAGIPYVISLHDAWWISDWHFLTDTKDRLRDPGEWLPFDPPEPLSVGAAIERRRFLRPLLSHAEAVLAVSRSFADLHRSCGLSDVVAVPNGVSKLKKVVKRASESGRVRLTHIGGQSKFKGYFLIEAVFKQCHFANLELTVVDVSREGGEELSLTWGNTPVRVVGKTPPENMHEYYARHDVLLAPSLWPEPFGLVSREALASGLWVVASDRGGVGEDVAPGVNGWVIDVGTPQGLIDVLRQIDATPAVYFASPPPTQLRTSQEQADDLLKIYGEALGGPKTPRKPYARETLSGTNKDPRPSSMTRRTPYDRPM